VLLYQSSAPEEVGGYAFVFRLRETASIKGTIYRGSGGDPVLVQDFGQQRGGRPFVFQWDLTGTAAPEGAYKLVMKGYVVSNNNSVAQVVHFYHRPHVK